MTSAEISVTADDVVVGEVPRRGWVVETQHGVTIALDTELTPDLEAEGVTRDLVRAVQQARRDADLNIADRITLQISGPADVLSAAARHRDLVANETLATTVEFHETLADAFAGVVGNGSPIAVRVVKI